MTDSMILDAPDVRLTVSVRHGGRMASLVVHGHELLLTAGLGPIMWGAYPFAPFAGRIRDGRFTFDGRHVGLPLNMPPNAIHGTVFDRAWTVDGPDAMSIDLGPDWPFAGRVSQRFALDGDGVLTTLRLEADERMPATLGWHPWFVRRLPGAAAPLELSFEADTMYERGTDGLPTGRLVAPGPRPWDDCFVGLRSAPRLTWPGALTLELTSSCDHWVVYDESSHALCVEPQTGPPNEVNLGPRTVLEPGDALEAWMRWRWWSPGQPPPSEWA